MRIAIIRNTPEAAVLTRSGRQNREYYAESDIEAVRQALTDAGHEPTVIQGDVHLFDRLRALCLPPDDAGRPQFFVYNMAYGVQGECRYTHIPSMLELAGIPYVGSGPRAHTICLDKYLAKIVLVQAKLPTPAFQLMTKRGEALNASLTYPVIVKPQFESTSFGIQVVDDGASLDAAVGAVLDEFSQPALIEQFVAGTEVNCGTLGNNPARALPVLEVAFSGDDPRAILTHETKRNRVATHICPARLDADQTARVQALAVAVFDALGCADCGRVDFRIDANGQPFVLEMNSMVATHLDSSYYHAAKTEGMSFTDLVSAVLEAAVARYAPKPGD